MLVVMQISVRRDATGKSKSAVLERRGGMLERMCWQLRDQQMLCMSVEMLKRNVRYSCEKREGESWASF